MSLICIIIGHRFREFQITEWGIPYDRGHWEYFDYCQRCGKRPTN